MGAKAYPGAKLDDEQTAWIPSEAAGQVRRRVPAWLARPAALIPLPAQDCTRYHGVLAPHVGLWAALIETAARRGRRSR